MDEMRYCQYASGVCDQNLPSNGHFTGFFIYPSKPSTLASCLVSARNKLEAQHSGVCWMTWEDLTSAGKIVFCEICKAIIRSELVVANITTLNFNVLFELGYAVGLQKPVLPLRDETYERDADLFKQIGLFDVIGYESFSNHTDIVEIIESRSPSGPVIAKRPELCTEPIYCLKAPVESDGSLELHAALEKGYFSYRTFDPAETPRLSLHEAFKQVFGSLAVVVHLMDFNRSNAKAHNARGAFVCGMALAAGCRILALQEGQFEQPIDYRDIVLPYSTPEMIPKRVETIVRGVADDFQKGPRKSPKATPGILERIDLGDVAAENEVHALPEYFVNTPQYQQTIKGHAQLVTGRKGSGKTAIFYAVRDSLSRQNCVIIDLKPEGYQFAKLRDTVLKYMSEGIRMHTLTAFWNYLLLLEVLRTVIQEKERTAYGGPDSLKEYQRLKKFYEKRAGQEHTDFSERLMALVNRIVLKVEMSNGKLSGPEISSLIYKGDVKKLRRTVREEVGQHENIWLLFDNIDKGWPTQGGTKEDVAILTCLIDAVRSLQRSLSSRGINFRPVIFLRKDIHDLLVRGTSDRGKESVADLDWTDTQLLKELIRKRLSWKTGYKGDFARVWPSVFDPHVGGQSSIDYILDRTFLKPRDVLNFIRKSIQTAASKEHEIVTEGDVKIAEEAHSEDMLKAVSYEIRDVRPDMETIPYAFTGESTFLPDDLVTVSLMEKDISQEQVQEAKDLLLWFSFLGVVKNRKEYYSYQYMYNLNKLKALLPNLPDDRDIYVIHPAFRIALQTT